MTNCSFQSNTAINTGGAIHNAGNGGVGLPKLVNCVFFGNGGNNTFSNSGFNLSISLTYSLFEPSSVTATGINTSGPGNLPVTTSPFASTASTQLACGSPAINMGNPATTSATVGATDLAGNARIANGRIDMGAFESAFSTATQLYVRAGATGANTGLSWTDAYTDLQSALNICASNLTQIRVAAGLYKPTTSADRSISFAMKNGVTILGGFAGTGGTPDVRTPLSSTLSGNISSTGSKSDNSYHVIKNASGLTSTAILDGFVITDGYAEGGSSSGNGAGMYNEGSNGQVCSPTIRNCLFLDNYAYNSGGAIANVGSTSGTSSPTLINCGFQNNSAYAAFGGAVYNYRTTGGSSRPVFINCSFLNNRAIFSDGGAIANHNDGSSGITSTTLTNCVSYSNGGNNTFSSYGTNSLSASYCLFEASVTGYVSGPGNLTISGISSPFVSFNSMQLAACSPAINAGLNSAITATGLTTDIAGNPRLYAGGTVDMGAYEFSSPLPTPTSLGTGTPTATSVTATWTMTPATAPTEIRWRAIGTTAWSSGTVATGIGSYSITGLTVETTYEWQVRPNCPATPNYISGNNFSTSPYCRPTYIDGCNRGNALTSFSLDNVPLSQGSGCSAGSFTYITTNRQIASGQTVNVSGTFSGTYSEGVTIWADLNRNNLFDSNEILYQRPSVPGPFSGLLTIPPGTAIGALRIRVMVVFGLSPSDPCGYYIPDYSYGETEDYLITVITGSTCTAMTTTKAGAWNDPTVWSCNRVPTNTDAVTIGHIVTVPGGVTSNALKISYGAGGKLSFGAGSKVRLGL